MSTSMIYYLFSLILTLISSKLLQYNFNMNLLYSFIILTVGFGLKDTFVFFLVVIVNIAVIKTLKSNLKRYIFLLNLLIISICGFYYKTYIRRKQFDICGPIMALIIRLYYVSKAEDLKYLDIINYLFFSPTILAGPSVPVKEFIAERKVDNKIGFIKIIKSICFIIVHFLIASFFDIKNTYGYSEPPFYIALSNLWIVCFGVRCKYYFMWIFASGCSKLAGYDFDNIHPLRVELSKSVKDLTSSWNVYTNMWLKDGVFNELECISKFFASMATFTVSSLWHGTNICYFLIFLSFGLVALPLKNNYGIIKHYLGTRAADVIGLITVSLYVAYVMVPFITLDINITMKIWSDLYFYGYVYLAISTIIYCLHIRNKNNNK